jgi:hypothetical protein
VEQILAPIVVFTYKRLDTLQKTISSLKDCHLSNESDLIVFSDGPKTADDMEKVQMVRDYVSGISGFKSVTLKFSEHNKGLAKSIITGVTEIFEHNESIIVLEDDLKLSGNFLTYMNACLKKYKNNPQCFSVSGYNFDLDIPADYEYDVFFTKRHCSWGWAMWKDRWMEIDWDVIDYPQFAKSLRTQREFNKIGSDLSSSLKRQQEGKINSWAIRCVYFQFKKQTFTAYPIVSKVSNIGFGDGATHTRQQYNKFNVSLEPNGKSDFRLPGDIIVDSRILKKFTDKFSISTRLYYKLLNTLSGNKA